MLHYIRPTSDIFIRYLLGSEHHKDILLDFINAVLLDADFRPVKSVEILNPFNLAQVNNEKESILDIKAQDDTGKIFNIEIQAIGDQQFISRSLYYWAKAYSSQLDKGDKYHLLHPVICINILEFALIPGFKKTHTVFIPTEKDNPGLKLTEHFKIHFIDFPKFDENTSKIKDDLKKWLLYLDKEGKPDQKEFLMGTVLEGNEAIQKAHEMYEKFTSDPELLQAYQDREKFHRDRAYHMDIAKRQGLEQGLQEGRQQGLKQGLQQGLQQGEIKGELNKALETARNMVVKGYNTGEVCDLTGLTEVQLKEHGVIE